MRRLIVALIAVLSFGNALAVEVAGVRFDDNVRLADSDVVINGVGVRKKVFFQVYAMALYLPEKRSEVAAVLSDKGAKRVAITLMRDLTAQQFVDALQEGIADNHSETEAAALKDRVRQFSDAMLSVGEAKTGSTVLIDWIPGAGTRLTVNGEVKGKDIDGDDFFAALLRIWLGNEPVQDDLKESLLGKAS
jgi:hypothetical protein